jgi:hypothetical protein
MSRTIFPMMGGDVRENQHRARFLSRISIFSVI